MPAYLDNAASTPMRPEAVEAMLPWLTEPGNPSGAHAAARRARKAIDEAREQIAVLTGAEPGEVVFTSGGTEADNLAVFGRHDARGGLLVCSAIEHHAVLDPVRARGGRVVPVDANGCLDLDALRETLTRAADDGDDVTLVAVMLVNNEIGAVQPLAEAVDIVRDAAPGAAVLTDAVQALAWTDVATAAGTADLIALSGHKFGGPKGTGALVVRRGTALAARTSGGGQEADRRSGTQNTAGIVGMATAARLAAAERAETIERVAKLRDRLADGLRAAVPGLVETGVRDDVHGRPDRSQRIAGTCHVCIAGVETESLLVLFDRAELAASAASSCASGALEPSHVLAAMGIDDDLAAGSLRLSLGWASTDAEVDAALEVIPAAVEQLRRLG